MSASTQELELVAPLPAVARSPFGPLATLARRRFQLSARTPRELVVPLLTPILFALVIAPALKQALHTSRSYEAFVATGTIGLLIPLNTMLAGIGVLVDREAGAPSLPGAHGRQRLQRVGALCTSRSSGRRSRLPPLVSGGTSWMPTEAFGERDFISSRSYFPTIRPRPAYRAGPMSGSGPALMTSVC